MQTAYHMVWMAAQRTPTHLALVDDRTDRRLTYSEMINEVDLVAASLKERGIVQGDRVATILPSLFDHCLVLLALQRICAIPALINFRLKPEEISRLIEDGKMKAAVILPDQDVFEAVISFLPKNGIVLTVGGEAKGGQSFIDCRGDPAGMSWPNPDREDTAFIFYTSGTTGLPKGVVLSHRTSEHRIIWLSTQAGLRHGTHNKSLGFMPLSHAIGFYGVFLVTLALNGTYYVMSAFNPVDAVDMVEKYGITYMFAIPQMYFAMCGAPNYASEKMKTTELVLFGGAKINDTLLKKMDQEWTGSIRHIYGTTETMCSLYNPNPIGQHIRLRPGFYSRIRVVRVGGGNNDLVKPGQEGELIVDANVDTVFTEYLGNPETTAEKIVDGWYYTGDVCFLYENGDVDLIGRVDDLIRSGGENIHPGEIEELMIAHPKVKEIAIIGVQDEKWGERVTACIVAEGVSTEELDVFLRQSNVADFKRPRFYIFMDILPRNAANKILRRELTKILEELRNGGSKYKIHEVL